MLSVIWQYVHFYLMCFYNFLGSWKFYDFICFCYFTNACVSCLPCFFKKKKLTLSMYVILFLSYELFTLYAAVKMCWIKHCSMTIKSESDESFYLLTVSEVSCISAFVKGKVIFTLWHLLLIQEKKQGQLFSLNKTNEWMNQQVVLFEKKKTVVK